MKGIFRCFISFICIFTLVAAYIPAIEIMAADIPVFTDDFDDHSIADLTLKTTDADTTNKWHGYRLSENSYRSFSDWTPKIIADPTVTPAQTADKVLLIDNHLDDTQTANEHLEVSLGDIDGKINVEFEFYVPSANTYGTGYNATQANNKPVKIGLIDADSPTTYLSYIEICPNHNGKVVCFFDASTVYQEADSPELGYNKWHKVCFEVDTANGKIISFINDIQKLSSNIGSDKKLGELRITPNVELPKSAVYVDNVNIYKVDDTATPPTDPDPTDPDPTDPDPTDPVTPVTQDIISYADILNDQAATNVTAAMIFPSSKDGHTITWSSSDPSVNVTTGAVTPLEFNDKTVKLTAEIKDSSNVLVDTKYFYVIVAAQKQEVKFTESFASAPTGASKPVAMNKTKGDANNYGNWTLYSSAGDSTYSTAKGEGTEFNVIKEPESIANNVMQVVRTAKGGTNLRISNPLTPSLDSGIVKLKMRYKTKTGNFGFSLFNGANHVIFFLPDEWYVNNTKVSSYTVAEKNTITAVDVWHTAEFVLNYDERKAELYVDGMQIGGAYQNTVPALSDMNFCYNNNWEPGEYYVDDIIVTKAIEPDYLKFEEFANGQTASNVTSDLNLMVQKNIDGTLYDIEWSSNDETVIAADGTVTPAPYGDKIITLTAKIKLASDGTLKKTMSFDVVVTAANELYYSNFTHEDNFEGYSIGNLPYGGANKWSDYAGRGFDVQWTPKVVDDPSGAVNKVMAIDKYTDAAQKTENHHIITKHSPLSGTRETTFSFYVPSSASKPGYNAIITSDYIKCGLIDSALATTYLMYLEFRLNNGSGKVALTSNGQSATVEYDTWNTIRMSTNMEDGIDTLYVNGNILYTGPVQSTNTISELRFDVNGKLPKSIMYIDNLSINTMSMVDGGAVYKAAERLDLSAYENVSEKFILQNAGDYETSIEWISDTPSVLEVIDNLIIPHRKTDGTISTAKLTARVIKNDASYERDFFINVLPINEVETKADAFSFENIGGAQEEYHITDSLTLPSTYDGASITWTSGDESVMTSDGDIVRDRLDKPVTLEAKFNFNGEEFIKVFDLIVAGTGKIIAKDDIAGGATEGQDIDNHNGWVIEHPRGKDGIDAIVCKSIMDMDKPFEKAEKVLSITRTMTSLEGNVNHQKVVKNFGDSIRNEVTSFDFDCMFTTDKSSLYFEISGSQKFYIISKDSVSVMNGREFTFPQPLDLNKWYHFTFVHDAYANTYDVYFDYVKLNTDSIYLPGNRSFDGVKFYSNAKRATVHENFMIRRLMVRDITVDSEIAVQKAKAALTLGAVDYDRGEIILPLYASDNVTISWNSSAPSVITNEGKITRYETNRTVKLTATIKKGDAEETKDFIVIVNSTSGADIPTTDILNVVAEGLTEESITEEPHLHLTKDIVLPSEILNGKAADIGGVDITWTSQYPEIIKLNNAYGKIIGNITKQPYGAATKLTATISAKSDPTVFVTKELKFAVDLDGEIYFNYDFEDVPDNMNGEELTLWSTMEKRANESGKEYGIQIYADREPQDSKKSNEAANHAMFVQRYTGSVHDNISSMAHATIKNHMNGTYYYGDMLAMNFKAKFLTLDDQVTMEFYCLKNRYVRIKPRALTVSSSMLTHYFSTPLDLNEWHEFLLYFDTVAGRLDIYVNGEYILSEPIQYEVGFDNFFNQWRIYQEAMGFSLIDDIQVKNVKKPDEGEMVENALKLLSIPETADGNITLPIAIGGCSISWKSSDESVMSSGGVVNLNSGDARNVTLTATVRNGVKSSAKSFNIRVSPLASASQLFQVSDVDFSGENVSSVTVKKISNASADAQLLVIVYNQNNLCTIHKYNLTAMTSGQMQTIPANIPLTDLNNCKIKAFVWDCVANDGTPLSNIITAVK